jgi:hypothetical protein
MGKLEMSMKKSIFLAAILICLAGVVFAQKSGQYDMVSDRGFFISWGLLYSHEKIEPNPVFESNGLSGTFGLGYDFGRVSLNLAAEYMLVSLVEYQGYGYDRNPQIKESNNMGLGLNIEIKILNGGIFDITVPVGGLLRFSGFNIKHDTEKTFRYVYLNMESGLIFSWRISRNYMVFVPVNIGYPVYKGSKFDVLNYSLGIVVRRTY